MLKKDDMLPESLDEILELSQNEEVMEQFLEKFVSCVVGRIEWKRSCKDQPISKIASATDEAFALLVLENIWDSWRDVDPQEYLLKRRERVEPKKQAPEGSSTSQKRPRQKEIPGKYTEKHRNAKRYRGWSEEGFARFNQLVRMVREDRAQRKEFEVNFLAKQKADGNDNGTGHNCGATNDKLVLEDDWGELYPSLAK